MNVNLSEGLHGPGHSVRICNLFLCYTVTVWICAVLRYTEDILQWDSEDLDLGLVLLAVWPRMGHLVHGTHDE